MYLNVRHEILKLVQERARITVEAIGSSKDFLSITQFAQQLKEGMYEWDYMKSKILCTTKEMVSKIKRLPRE
jgi:hypothetical protein